MDERENIIQKLNHYQGLIFDLDGTLAYLEVDWNKLKKDLTEYALINKNIVVEFTSLNKNLFELRKKYGEEFFGQLMNIIRAHETNSNLRLHISLVDYINSLMNKKYAIYSMNTAATIEKFLQMGVINQPDIIISKDTCTEPKPSGKDLLKIVRAWHLEINRVAFVGNSNEDLRSGEMAGLKTFII